MQEKLYPWRWAILIGMTVLLVSLQFSFIVPGGAAILVMQQYQCEPMMFSMIMSIPYFSGVLFCMAGGVLADRMGLGKVFAAAFVVSLLGALARCFSADYWTLFASSFFMGMGVAALNANSAKLLRLWFPGTANSFAMGVYTAGMSAGAALAIWYGSRVAAIQDAWWFSFGLMAVGVVAWFAVYRKHPDGEHRSVEPVGTYLRVVVKNWHVWAVAIVALLVFGMTNVNGSYMVAAVTALMGDPSLTAVAGDLSTLNTVIACVASMALPVVVLAVCCGRRHFPLSPAARVNAGDAFFGVLAAMGICVLANFVASYILAYLSQFGIEAPASPELLVHTPESLLYNILVIAVLPALLEEMVFRGYLLRALRPYGDWFAVGFSAQCFGLMHANIAQIPFAVIVGVALGWLYVMTDNIWLPVAVHFCNNAMSVLLDYLSTGMSQQVTSLYYLLVMLAVLLIGAVCMGILLVRRSALFRRLPSRSCLPGGARFGITLTAPVMLLSVIVLVVETIWKTVR